MPKTKAKTDAKKTDEKKTATKKTATKEEKTYIAKGNELYFAKVRPDAIIPTKRDEDAGYDMYANFEEDYFVIEKHTTKLVPTGIATCCSPKYYIQVEERVSTGKIGMKYSGGVIDSGFRGEHFIMLTNINEKTIVISKLTAQELGKTFVADGKKYKTANCIIYPYSKAIAQEIILPVPKMEVKELPYEELKAIVSDRKTGYGGSSGK